MKILFPQLETPEARTILLLVLVVLVIVNFVITVANLLV